ncbi:SH3 domain-containing protein [Cohnella luojiensis]|uniref:Hydrolase Nlp/P60 n=1 Tax=Cohnella luojiensis TaxID=652876 RepID=A0A4Y8M3L9_9BACL|nr:SH3 domain-containing protein [Cohnella luojiensis]TFE29370.1 hydrolase Nlp/P60 [Cohnella luojiensis]
MKKGIILFIASVLLFVSIPAFAAAQQGTTAVVVSSVSFRSGPSTSSNVMKYLKAGETVSVLEKTNSYWLKVQDGKGIVGYVSSNSKYISYKEPEQGQAGTNAIVVSSVSFRNAPSTNGALIRYLQRDERITITSVVNSYWYAVKDASGATGYVSSSTQYVKLTASLPQKPAPTPAPTPTPSQQVEKVIAAGLKYLGTPYEFGSNRNTTTTFDCSDFVRQAFKDALNVTLPASSRTQGAYVRDKSPVTTDWHSLKRGDLMFFMDYKGTKASSYAGKRPFEERISHVAIYLGDGKVLQTYSVASGGVRTDSIVGKHWEHRFLFGGSAL